MIDQNPEQRPETPEIPAGDIIETPKPLFGYALAWRAVMIDVARRTRERKAAMARNEPDRSIEEGVRYE